MVFGWAPTSATNDDSVAMSAASVVRARREDPGPAAKEIGTGDVEPGAGGAGDRMAADEAKTRRQRGRRTDGRALGAADVGDERFPWNRRGKPGQHLVVLTDRCGENDQVGAGGEREVVAAAVGGIQPKRRLDGLGAIDGDDLRRPATAAAPRAQSIRRSGRCRRWRCWQT